MKGKTAALLLGVALGAVLCGCHQANEMGAQISPSPYPTAASSPDSQAETEYGYPPTSGEMEKILPEYPWDWDVSEDTSHAYSSRQNPDLPPGSDKFQITEIVPIADGDGGSGMVNMHGWPNRALPDGTMERDVNLSLWVRQDEEKLRRFCENDVPTAFAAAGDLIGDPQYAADLAEKAGKMLAGLEYDGIQTALLRDRKGHTCGLCEYAWSETAKEYVFTSVTILKSEDLLALRTEDFAGDFKYRSWPEETVTVEEMASAGADEEKFLTVGRLEGILPAGEGLYYSAFTDSLLGGTAYEATLCDGAGEVKVRVLPTALNEEELGRELLHVVSRSEENGEPVYTVESSVLNSARYKL